MNKTNTNETLARMKALMGYGLQTESKNTYSSIEYQKLAADGQNYAIIREGKNYFIKVAPNKQNLVKEDYNYVGGFRNRKDYQYDSFANAQKNFELKMMSLKEAANKEDFNVSTWDLDKKENVVVEASDKMKKEILRERQIMKNAVAINEKKAVCCDAPCAPKDNIKGEKHETGKAEDAVAHEKAELPKEMTEGKTCPKCGKNPCQCETVNEEEVLGWNRNSPDYMDKTHGTNIGDSAPFDDATARNIDNDDKKVTKTSEMKNGVVENHGTSMHDTDNQNSPSVGVGEGPSDDNNQPFDDKKGKQIDEAIDDFGADGDTPMDDEPMDDEPMGDEPMGDEPMDDEPMGDEQMGDEPMDDEPMGDEDDDVYEDDLESRVSAMEDLLNRIASKLGVDEAPVDDEAYEDDDLFDDEDEFGDDGEDFGYEEDFDDDEDEMPMEGRNRRGVRIYESKAFREAMSRRKRAINEEGMTPFKDAGRVPSGNMNKLDDFGKHPAYQKKVMELPPKDMQEFPGYYDMNDDSVKSDAPYGEKIGDGAPFDIDPQSIDNAIAESLNRLIRMKKKI